MNIERLKGKECKEVVAFLDEVFTLQNGHQMDFANAFPRIFVEDDEKMHWYYAAKEDGKIIGTAASHPFTYRVGDETLKVSAGGNVAVSPLCRNRGIMQALLHRINEDLEPEGYDFAYLHGDRKRYRTFGFERCGTEYLIYFTPSMLKKADCVADVTLWDLRNEPETVLKEVMAIAHAQVSGFARTKADFLPAMIAHGNQPLVIRRGDQVVGYMSLDVPGAYLAELGLKNADDLGSVLVAVAEYLGGKATSVIRLPAYEHALVRRAITLCGRYNIIQPANFQIVRLENVLRVFLKAKGLYAPLADGTLTLDTELFGKWTVACKDGQVSVTPGEGEADIYLPDYRVYEFLFGPNDPFLAEVDTTKLPADKAHLVANWFPLPLYCPHLS